jgi:hypothetical protein
MERDGKEKLNINKTFEFTVFPTFIREFIKHQFIHFINLPKTFRVISRSWNFMRKKAYV